MSNSRQKSKFIINEASKVFTEVVEAVLGDKSYQKDEVDTWAGVIVGDCLKLLEREEKPFKYIVTSTIMQKSGAGLHTAFSCLWDDETDASYIVNWENATIYCIVSLFGVAA